MHKLKPFAQNNLLLQLIDEAYEKKTWHGPNLRGSIRGLTAQQAAWRPSPKRHSIWEIVVHTAYWKYTVRRRLLGEKRGSFPLEGSNWFSRFREGTEKAWKQDTALLDEMHRSMRNAIVKADHATLTKNLGVIYGIAFHDVYHAGQIQLLKRLYKGRRR